MATLTFVGILASAAAAMAQAPCPTVEPLRTGYGLDAPAEFAAEFDADGPGPGLRALYLSGSFSVAADQPADGLARWDGAALSPVPGCPAGPKGAMAAFDAGDGEALYIAGAPGVLHRFRQDAWDHLAAPVFESMIGAAVYFAVFDPDDGGPRPIGLFTLVHYPELAGENNSVLWRYDSQGWYRLSGPVPRGRILSFDADGPGGAIPVLLHHFNVERTDPQRVVGYVRRLHPTHWELLCYTGATQSLGITDAVAYEPAPGVPYPQGYFLITGEFNQIMPPTGGWLVTAGSALWNGSAWGAVPTYWGPLRATAAGVFRTGTGASLVLGSDSTATGSYFAIWRGEYPSAPWSPLVGSSAFGGRAITLLRSFQPGGTGDAQLVVSGELHRVGTMQVERFAVLSPEPATDPIAGGVHMPGPEPVTSLHAWDNGGGVSLYAGGDFRLPGGGLLDLDGIMRWDGAQWHRLGQGIFGEGVFAILGHDDGSGSKLYVGGDFFRVGGIPMWNLARWDGSVWSPVGRSELFGQHYTAQVNALAEFDPDGPGPEPMRLYVGGNFWTADDLVVKGLARWDGAAGWSAVPGFLEGDIQSLRTLDDGSGPALYVGCNWGSIEGLPFNRVYKLTQSGWEALPPVPTMSTISTMVTDVEIDHSAGTPRPLVIRFGQSSSWNGPQWRRLFRLEGEQWADLGPVESDEMLEVQSHGGRAVLVGGSLLLSQGLVPLSPAPQGRVRAMASMPGPGGQSVLLGGEFLVLRDPAGALQGASRVARVRLCGQCYPNCDSSTAAPVLNVADFTCFLQRFGAGEPWANCDGSTAAPALNIADFTCFLQRFAAGCP